MSTSPPSRPSGHPVPGDSANSVSGTNTSSGSGSHSSAGSYPPSDPAIHSHVGQYINARAAAPIYAFLGLHLPAADDSALRLVHASRGLVVVHLTIAPAHLNSRGHLHGSVSATLVDWAGGLAIASWDGRASTGVSVDLALSFLAPARIGDVLEIEGRADRVGTSMGFTQVGIWKVGGDGGRVGVALGRHTKFVKERAAGGATKAIGTETETKNETAAK